MNTLRELVSFVKGENEYFMILPLILMSLGVVLQVVAIVVKSYGY